MPKKTQRTAAQRKAWKKLPKWLRAKIRESPLQKWSAKIRREFGYKCADCGTNINLESHHIRPKKQFPSAKLDVDNGICLCLGCHDKAHKILAENETLYMGHIYRLSKSRVPIKRLKKRNPSGFNYNLKAWLSPTDFQAKIEELLSLEAVVDKPAKAKKTKKSRKTKLK